MNHPTALGIIDAQRGFMPASEGERLDVPGFGELPIMEGEHIVPYLNTLLGAFSLRGMDIFTTQDWHPERTAHFALDGNEPNFMTTWPPHCRANTPGAELHPEIIVPKLAVAFKKGQEELTDGALDTSYTGLNGVNERGQNLEHWLRQRGTRAVLLGGLALDYCVKATALDLRTKLGLDVTIAVDATESVAQPTGLKAIDELEAAGVHFVTTDEYLRKLEALAV
ncbi:MAG: isochorismatase hydrolase, nicotinamidase/pyrazinamidase [Candidatus Saccharibacteria bacterium]|nr:isochorismatase hydrolase, nicotinamidase/pyrazinamidase [Candidatus Saccharibacteria bacterium]